jgi:hypothetical protein
MNENDLIRAKYTEYNPKNISSFIKTINSCLSREAWRKVIVLDEQIETRSLLIMAAELQISAQVLRSLLIMRNEKIIANLITPQSVGPTEEKFLDKFRRISSDPDKVRIVNDLVEYLGSFRTKLRG